MSDKLVTYVSGLRSGFPRSSRVTDKYTVRCASGHEDEVSINELTELISFRACLVEDCGDEILELKPNRIELACKWCGHTYFEPWDRATELNTFGCWHCPGPTDGGPVEVVGSRSYNERVRDDWYELREEEYQREGRTDYWEGVVHYCGEEEFLSILEDGVIRAHDTGRFNMPAVCLTEAPIPDAAEIQDEFGTYGFAFHKDDILALGGNPCLDMSDELLSSEDIAIPQRLKPFVNVIQPDGGFYFLYEREWRVPHDIRFADIEPHIVLPSDEVQRRKVLKDDDVLKQINDYGRLRSVRIGKSSRFE